ncbi:hypothetical protein BJ742DRAFT_786692 [Cladochytrium replicatum]|nr:hypothetical protein BJ742DRAFT_786692 [Cladochytrium replicatum]
MPINSIDDIFYPLCSYLFLNPLTATVLWPVISFILISTPLGRYLTLGFGAIALAGVWALYVLRILSSRPTEWEKEIVLITGGSSGLGKTVIQTLLSRHANIKKIVIWDIAEPPFSDDRVAFYRCDISNKLQVKAMILRCITEVGQPTTIINNAGIAHGKLLRDLSDDEIERTFAVNVLPHYWIVKGFWAGLVKANYGHIISISSVLGFSGAAMVSDYSASKAAVAGFHESLRQELRGTNIKASCIYPGIMNTGMFDGVQYRFPMLSPMLETQKVADAVIEVMESGRSCDVKLPFYANAGWMGRALPIEFGDIIRNLLGANEMMELFRGRSKKIA